MNKFFNRKVEELTSKQRWIALIVLSVSLFVIVMDMTILIMALPDLIQDIKPSAAQQLWIVDIYSLVLAGFIIPMSVLADKWGRKKALLTGFFLFGLTSVLIIFAKSPEHVIILRFFLGFAGALIMPTTLSMIRTIFSNPKERATALAVWAVVSGLGSALGPIIGGLLLEYFSWQSTFLINIPFAAFAVVAGSFLLPEVKVKSGRWDIVGTVLSIIGMLGLVWSIKEFSKEGITDTTLWIVGIAAVILLTIFVIKNIRSSQPMLDVRLFKNRGFSSGILAAFMSMFSMAAVILLVSQWLQTVEGLSPFNAGLHLLPMAGGSLLFSPVAPSLAARFGPKLILPLGIATAGIGFLIIYFAGHPLEYSTLLIALILIGAGTAALALATTLIMIGTPVEKAGNASAMEEIMYDLGNVFGIAVLGSVASNLYRSHLNIEQFVTAGLERQLADISNESIAGAIEVANMLGLSELSEAAFTAFNDSFATTALIGGLIMIGSAITIYILILKSLDITKEETQKTH
ncbi:MFS transporter [Paenibacillus sp. IITD108]|uniref:MFS transporter n=1 Tax=Paenibacillus sp. IITD108 TaxID=3116649 RepID=UPI002F3F2655